MATSGHGDEHLSKANAHSYCEHDLPVLSANIGHHESEDDERRSCDNESEKVASITQVAIHHADGQ